MLPLLSQSERDEPEQRPSRMSIKRRDGAPAPAEPIPTRRKRAHADQVRPKIVPDRRRYAVCQFASPAASCPRTSKIILARSSTCRRVA